MPRPKKDDEHKKIPVKFYVLPSYIPIIKNVIKNLDENNAIDFISAMPEKNEKVEEVSTVIETEKPIKKASFGIDVNDWLAKHTDKVVNIEKKESEQKDYTAWQADSLMQDIYNSCLWTCGGENQEFPDRAEEYQRKHSDLWAKLTKAKQNNQMGLCNEIMTEMMERIYNE